VAVLARSAGRSLVRVDAATGRKLTPLPLPAPMRVDMSAGHDQSVRGILVLDVLGEGAHPPIVRTVALQASTGRLLWTRKNDLNVVPEGLFGLAGPKARTYTVVEPRTGRSRWRVPLDGRPPVMASPRQVAVLRGRDSTGIVQGLDSRGRTLWTSPPLARRQYLAATPDSVLLVTCEPWNANLGVELCADQRLTAVALTG
jgi:hypothetical protein